MCVTEIIFLILNQSICWGYSKEPSQWEGSFEHPKHMFRLLGKKIFAFLRSKFLYNWTYGLLSQFFFRRYKMCHIQSLLLLYIATCVSADLYLHSIRGSNNRLNEKTATRKTNDRLFDSQVGVSFIKDRLINQSGKNLQNKINYNFVLQLITLW